MTQPEHSEQDQDTLEGPRVLWSRPGQLVLSFAALCALTMGAQSLLAEPEPADLAPQVPAKVSSKVTRALDRADIQVEEEANGPLIQGDAQERGLVNLLRKVVPEEAPEANKEQPGGPQGDKAAAQEDEGVRIEDPDARLAPFYAALARTEAKEPGAVTRVMHYGDSVIVSDFVTSSARRKLQKRFGDAGHGFLLASKPWDYYGHQNVVFSADHWKVSRITSNTIEDDRYGLGGVTSRTWGPGAWALYKTSQDGPVGQQVSKLRLFYMAQPKGGKVAIEVDGEEVALVDTQAEALEDRVHDASFSDGPHKIKVVSRGGGEVRLYGAAMEREQPGVVYDSLGITGIRAKTMGRFDEEHFKTQLKQRDPHLVILMLGTNGSEFTGISMEEYAEDYTRLVRRVRAALPDRACLVASPPDRAQKDKRGRLTTVPLLKEIIKTQREVALKEGCAFWSTYEAMGGQDAMVAWYRHQPRLASGDFTHFTKAGGEALGILLYDALMANKPRR